MAEEGSSTPCEQVAPQNQPMDTQNVLDIGLAQESFLAELQNVDAFIAHKSQELNVYTSSKQLIETRAPGEECLVFLGDNLFVSRTREQALEILDRQINFFQEQLKCLEDIRKDFERRFELLKQFKISEDGLVEIREPVAETEEIKKKAKRIAHPPQKRRMETEEEEDFSTKPKGVSNKDYRQFLDMVDQMNLSGDELDEECGDDENGENEEAMETDEKKRVHFAQEVVTKGGPSTGKQSKSILRNRNEHSPIDAAEVQKMDERDVRQVVPTTNETLSETVTERRANPSKEVRAMPNKRRGNKKKPISTWKAKRMGLPDEGEE